MDYIRCRETLREYFSDILYIDDEFDDSLVETDDAIVPDDLISEDMPLDILEEPVPEEGMPGGEEWRTVPSAEERSAAALMNMIKKMNRKEFSGISLTPIVFDKNVTEQFIVDKMLQAHLTIIDWDLGDGRKALPIIKGMMEKTERLKVVVVYTNGFLEACKSAEELFEEAKYVKEERYVRCLQLGNKSLIFIMDRRKLNIKTILDEAENIFLQENGVMPVAVLNIANKFQEKSGNIFGSFCRPIEDMYFLQMFYSEVREWEISDYLSEIILRKVYSGVRVDCELGSELLLGKKNALAEVLRSDDLAERIHNTVVMLRESVPEECRLLLEVQEEVEHSTYFHAAENLERLNQVSWAQIVSQFKPVYKEMKKKCLGKRMDEFFGDKAKIMEKGFPETYKRVHEELKKDVAVICTLGR